MKRLCLLISMICCVNAPAQTLYPGNITGCIARWDFANTGNPITTIQDVSGNGNHGTPYNLTTTTGFRNAPNKGMLFNGSTGYGSVPNASILQPSQITMVGVVKMNGFYSGPCQVSMVVNKGNDQTTGFYRLAFTDNNFDLSCNISSPNNHQLVPQISSMNVFASLPAGNYVTTGQWYFLAASFNGTTHKYYQVLMDPNNYVSNITPYFTHNQSGSIGTNTNDVLLGRHIGSTYPYWFNGSMEEVALFNRVLPDSEIQKVYDYLWGIVAITSVSATTFCPGQNFTVNYSVNNTSFFASNNVFTVQLSNASGSFASPVTIGSITASGGGTIPCTIPPSMTPGTGYRIRIVANNVPYTSNSNAQNLTISTGTLNFTIGPDTAICPGQSLFLQPTGAISVGSTYLWSNNSTGSSIIVNTPGTYWLKVTYGLCSATDTIHVGTQTSLAVSLGNDTAICPGETVTLQPAGSFGSGATYQWNTSSTNASIQAAATGTYWVKVTNGSCMGTDTININAKAGPPVNIGNDTVICSGAPLTIATQFQQPGNTYLWSTGATTPSISINSTGSFWLKVTNGFCVSTDTIHILPKSNLAVFIGNDTSVCEGTAINLYSSSVPPGSTFQWNTGSTSGSAIALTAGKYWLKVTNGSCTGSDTMEITWKPKPALEIGSETGLCEGSVTRLQNFFHKNGYEYLWSTGSGAAFVDVAKPGKYWVVLTADGCRNSDTANVFLKPSPFVFIEGDTAICPGDSVELTSSKQPGVVHYLWNNNSKDPSVFVNKPGVYWLSVSLDGCIDSDTIRIKQMDIPAVWLGGDTLVCYGDELILPKLVIGGSEYFLQWQDGSKGYSYTVAEKGKYTVIAFNKCGDTRDTINVDFRGCNFMFPSGFTPNGDGKNDVARLLGSLDDISDFTLRIYNRWGNEIFSTNDPRDGWNGNQGGRPADIGTYYYFVKFNFMGEPHLLKGDVTLVR